ncbi:MAG: phosphotransferase [Defluviitaleaceae bacterium]|nr:phosphotransferase [Defluviitaleaceae bacterium]
MLNLEVIGKGATTTVYRDGNKAIKLYVNAPPNEAENEANRQRFAVNAGLPVPAVFGVRHINDNMVALDMEYIIGKPLMQQKMDADERKNAIETLVKLQCAIHRVEAIGQPKQADRIAQKIKNTPHIFATEKSRLLESLGRPATDCNSLCHGDFHPLNIIYDGDKHWIIDWVDATAGNPLADACRTYLLFKQFITRQAGIYLSAFCKEANVKSEDVLSWLPVLAAARLDENVDDNARLWLLDIIKNNG